MNTKKTNEDQELLERTAHIYRSITRDSMDGFWIVDMEGHFLDVNDAYCTMMGYTRSELLKMNVADVDVKRGPKAIATHLAHIKKTGKSQHLAEHRTKSGSTVHLDLSANYANFKTGLVFVFVRDISTRKQAQTELVQNRVKQKEILEAQLAASYKQLGLVNRKISLLLELGKIPRSKKYRQQVADHVLNLAMSALDSSTGYLYGAKVRGAFTLVSSKGVSADAERSIRVITQHSVGLLKYLAKERKTLMGDIQQYEAELLALDNKLEYFVTVPLGRGSALGGFIFLGFDKKRQVDPDDLEFLEVFAMHASSALVKVGVLT